MSTLSVPLPDDLRTAMRMLVKQGVASNDAEFARRAIRKYIEDQAVEAVLRASKEPPLKGNLKELAKKI